MAKVIYNYYPETAEHSGQSHADESPLEPGVYLLPAHSTDIAPPALATGTVAVFRDGNWHVEEDHRGTTYWLADGTQRLVAALGPMPRDALAEAPAPSPAQIAVAKRDARNTALKTTDWLVARHRDELLVGGRTTLDQGQVDALLAYRKALRDFPTATHWPYVDLPEMPDFIVTDH